MKKTFGGDDHTSVFVDVHESALLINLHGYSSAFRNTLEPGLFELDGKRLHTLRRPQFHLRRRRIAICDFAGYRSMLPLMPRLMDIHHNVILIDPDCKFIADFHVRQARPLGRIEIERHSCSSQIRLQTYPD